MQKNEQLEPDLYVQNEGSIFILYPLSQNGKDWVAEHIPEDAMQWCGGIVVEHRFIGAIVDGAQNDGLIVE